MSPSWRASRASPLGVLSAYSRLSHCPTAGDAAHSGAPADMWLRHRPGVLPGGGAGEPLSRVPVPPNGLGSYLSAQVGRPPWARPRHK
jgi:hypothetical protein